MRKEWGEAVSTPTPPQAWENVQGGWRKESRKSRQKIGTCGLKYGKEGENRENAKILAKNMDIEAKNSIILY